jgi:hypothetical protein
METFFLAAVAHIIVAITYCLITFHAGFSTFICCQPAITQFTEMHGSGAKGFGPGFTSRSFVSFAQALKSLRFYFQNPVRYTKGLI